MAQHNHIDMLHGPLQGKIIKFALPIAASSILAQLFNTVDVAVAGRFAGSQALAAVGANTFIINLLINLFFGLSIGASVALANFIGLGDKQRIARGISTAAALALVSGALLLVLGQLVARPVLELIDTPADVLDDAELYLRIFLLGSPFFMVYTFGSGILRSRGDSKRPLYILAGGGVVNVALNILLVAGLGMGVAGVAVGTCVSNVFCSVAITRLLVREPGEFRLDLRNIRIYRTELRPILHIGVPAGMQGMLFSIGNIFVQSSINTFGSAAVAGSSVAQTFEAYCYFLMAAFSSAATTFVGQNYGAGKIDRCRRAVWICMCYGALLCAAANLLIWHYSAPIMSLFTTDPAVAAFGCLRIEHVLVFQIIAASYDIPSAGLRGLGHSIEPTLFTILGTCVLRMVWVMAVFPVWNSYTRLLLVYPLSWIITGALVLGYYLHIIARMSRQARLRQAAGQA